MLTATFISKKNTSHFSSDLGHWKLDSGKQMYPRSLRATSCFRLISPSLMGPHHPFQSLTALVSVRWGFRNLLYKYL